MQTAPWFYNVISLLGLAVMVLLSALCGLGRGPVPWRTVIWGLILQLALAFFFFAVPAGGQAMLALNDAFLTLLASTKAGATFLFGPLAVAPGQPGSIGFVFAVQALSTVVFFMACMAILYQLGLMQRVVRLLARLFARTMGLSGAESLGVASSIMVGAEMAGVVRPYLPEMTRSELFLLLTAAMATVASTVMGVIVANLHVYFPNIAGHLISASVISAPAAAVVAKLMEPETGQPLTAGQVVDPHFGRYDGVMEAVSAGALDGVKLAVGIAAMLLAFLSLTALLDHVLSWLTGLVGLDGVGLKELLTWLAWPFAVLMGVPLEDAPKVAALIGQRALITELPAYAELANMLARGDLAYSRSAVIASYALCGFAHVGSVAIFVGGFGALAPGRVGELARLGFKALWAATLVTVMTGCVAGLFAWGGRSILGIVH